MASEKVDHSPVTPRRRKRIVVVLILIALGFIGGWWGGVYGLAAHRYANFLTARERLLYADDWYQRAVAWGDDSQSLWFSRARLARKLSRDDGFVKFLELAVERGLPPSTANTEMLLARAQRGDLEPLRNVLGDLLVKGDDADEICYAYVQGCIIKYQLDQAMQVLDLWQADYENDARPHFLRGRLLEHRVNLEGAKKEFLAALDKNSKYAAASYNLARVLETEQKPAEAIPHYEHCAETLKNPVPGMVGKARCLRLMQEYDVALKTLQKAEQYPTTHVAEAFRLLGDPGDGAEANLLSELGYLAATRDDHDAAVRYFSEAMELNPNDWRGRYQLALSLRQVGKIELAKENFAKVDEVKQALATCDLLFDLLKEDPENVEARLQIGQVFLEHLSENQGLVWLNSVLDYDPDNIEAHRALAEYFQERQASHPEFAKLAAYHQSFLNQTETKQQQ